jgi:hypothetical protein
MYTASTYLTSLAGLERRQGRLERSVQLLGGVESLLEAIEAQMDPPRRAEFDCEVAAARDLLDETSFTTAWEKGRAMTPEETLRFATEQELKAPV